MMYCQRCRSPLRSDNSLDHLNPAAFDLLVGSATKPQRRDNSSHQNYPQARKELYDKTIKDPKTPQYRRNIPAPESQDGAKRRSDASLHTSHPGMSFIEITESQIVSHEKEQDSIIVREPQGQNSSDNAILDSDALSWQIKRNQRVASVLSAHSDIDHPICSECSSVIVSQLNTRLGSATRERDAYASFLKTLQQASAQTDTDVQKELEALANDEERAYEELLQLEQEKSLLEADLASLEDEARQLDAEERMFWESRNAFDDNLHELQVELTSLQEKYTHDQIQLERLQRTNVYNDTFCIGHDGFFGTINGLRLGRLASQNVEWAEINAAWGQTLLLLATVAERLGFQFQDYRLRPLGSTSRIDKLEWPQQPPDANQRPSATSPPKVTQLNLFSSGEMPLGRVFNHRRFDAGMVAFLDCLSQVGKHVEKASKSSSRTSKPMILPYKIEGDKIEHVSIRLGAGFSSDENFTKACKYTLTCCKFLLAHVSNLETSKGG